MTKPERITFSNCKEITGYNYIDILALTGVFALHNFPDLMTADVTKFLWINYDNGVINFEIRTVYLAKHCVQINFNSFEIINALTISTKRKQGIAFALLDSQIKEAKKFKFNKLITRALKAKSETIDYIGYIIWGKYGYTMNDYSQKKFLLEMERFNQENRTDIKRLYDLLQFSVGFYYWAERGFTWQGVFLTHNKSENVEIFETVSRFKKAIQQN